MKRRHLCSSEKQTNSLTEDGEGGLVAEVGVAAEVSFVVADGGVGGDAADAAAVVGRGGAQAQAAHRREGQRPRASVHVHRRLCKRGEGMNCLSNGLSIKHVVGNLAC